MSIIKEKKKRVERSLLFNTVEVWTSSLSVCVCMCVCVCGWVGGLCVWAAVRERGLWWQLSRWVVNDVAPGVPDPCAGHTSCTEGRLNKQVLRVLHELGCAQDFQDCRRVTFLQVEL